MISPSALPAHVTPYIAPGDSSAIYSSDSDGSDLGTPEPVASMACIDAIAPEAILLHEHDPVAEAAETFADTEIPNWGATEQLLRYTPGEAARILNDLRTLAKRCATYAGAAISIDAGPSFGSESAWLKVQNGSGDSATIADAILIRAGDVLIIVDDGPVHASDHEKTTIVPQLATAAYTSYARS